ncbi:hypothetical protein AAF712_013810 [Marasmius tenuissimus]|uniref:Nephrocystin 3-like N-terminal domain-containing protein n=1 Tax=Marasmius tenuissimus TaxID=585030 RepID=A0ABR2ZCP0_9AGAR
MAQYRPEAPSTRQKITTLANASHVEFKGSPNLNSVGGNQYNYHNVSGEPDPLKQFLEQTDFAFYYDCHGRHQSYPSGSTLSRSSEIQVAEDLKAWACPDSDNNEKESRVLWLRGSAGTGKSTIAALLAKLCDEQSEPTANFFFSRSNPNLNHSRFLVPALAHGLISSYPDLAPLVHKSIRDKHQVLKADLDSQFQQLIAQPLLQLKAAGGPDIRTKLILLDGINECLDIDHQRLVLSMVLSAVTKGLPLRFLICSRSENHIWEYFSDPSLLTPYTKYLLLDGDPITNGKVRSILMDGFKEMSSSERFRRMNLSDPWPPIRDLETLVEKASGEADFANTVVRFLEHHPRPQEQLKEVLSLPTSYADRLSILNGQTKALTMVGPRLLHQNSFLMPSVLSQPLDSTSVHTSSPDAKQPLNAASSSLYRHILFSTYGGNESCVHTVVAIALLHANPALMPRIPVTHRTLVYLFQTPQKTDLGAIGSCLIKLQGPDDEIVAYHPSFFQFLLALDKESKRQYCSYLMKLWFSFIRNECLEKKERNKMLDAVLLGWPSFRLETGMETLFLQNVMDINFTKLFALMLQISWNTASSQEWTSEEPETIGVSTLYRQIEELIPWLQGLDSNRQTVYLLERLKRFQCYFCITPPPVFAGLHDDRLRWIVMQIAGCKWKCGVTEKARNSFKSSTNPSTSMGEPVEVISVGNCQLCQRRGDSASQYTAAHYRIDTQPWCIQIAKDLRDEIRRNPSPEAYANLVQSSLLPLCFADPLPHLPANVFAMILSTPLVLAQTNATNRNLDLSRIAGIMETCIHELKRERI